eukprot:2553403-Pyramimonas_sp.AAC.1
MPRLATLPEVLQKYVKKGFFCGYQFEAEKAIEGLFGCCSTVFKSFIESRNTCCSNPQRTVLAICVSGECDMLITGQHRCTECLHFMCNFCCPEEEVFICRDCQEGKTTIRGIVEKGLKPKASPPPAASKDVPISTPEAVQVDEDVSPEKTESETAHRRNAVSDDEEVEVSPCPQAVAPTFPTIEVSDLEAGDLLVTISSDSVPMLCQVASYDPLTNPQKLKVFAGAPGQHALSCVDRSSASLIEVELMSCHFPTQCVLTKTQKAWEYGLPGFKYCDQEAFFRHEQKQNLTLFIICGHIFNLSSVVADMYVSSQ